MKDDNDPKPTKGPKKTKKRWGRRRRHSELPILDDIGTAPSKHAGPPKKHRKTKRGKAP